MPNTRPFAQRMGHDLEEQTALMDREESHALVTQISNLDAFFEQIYAYFYARGFLCLLADGVLRIARTVFVILFTAFLVLFVDWRAVTTCRNEACETVRLARAQPLSDLGGLRLLCLVVEAAFILHLLVLVLRFLSSVRESALARHVFHQMDLDEAAVATVRWEDVAERLVRLQSQVLFSRVGPVDQLHIAMRLTRIDNFMVALFSAEVVDFSLAGLPVALTRSLEWNLRYLLNFMVTKQQPFRRVADADTDVALLRTKIRWLGIMNLLAAPFVSCYLLLMALFAHGAELKLAPRKAGMRRWSRLSMWRLREYNELPHAFAARLQRASPLAQAYVDQFPFRLISIVARTVVFIAGGFACAILLLSFLNYPLLLFIEVRGQNLLWWLSVLSVFIVTGLQLSNDDQNQQYDAAKAMEALAAETHHLSPTCRDLAGVAVLEEFTTLYPYLWSVLFQEVVSVFVTPAFLIWSLPAQADRLVRFVRDHTVVLESAGPVCVFSTFEVDGFPSITRAQREKLVWSFRSFCAANPTWSPEGRERILEVDGVDLAGGGGYLGDADL
eukprot:EG_transcript_4210